MADSRIPGVLNAQGYTMLSNTPGVLGWQDYADPTRVWPFLASGNTPGPLGLHDHADPARQAFARRVADWSSAREPVCRVDTALPFAGSSLGGGVLSITVVQLQKLFSAASESLLNQIADELNGDLKKCGLDTRLRQAHFFAQIREEAGAGLRCVESLNYSPEALRNTFKYYRLHPKEADADGYERDAKTKRITRQADEETVANKAYANRQGNGTVASGDGWLFRGRGFVQVTGRAAYATATQQYRSIYQDASIDFEKNPELMGQTPYNVRSAVCYWLEKGLHQLADRGDSDADVDRITAVINLHTDSYAKRRHHFSIARAAFV